MAAGSRKEEERNERIVRGLLKLPPNRRCVNCNAIGPQYVCTSFWTFVCISCSGIHREFTHRVKSVSMSTFSTQEVEALQKGGNQRVRESFLKDFYTQKMRLPDSSNINSLREFIKAVYVERRYAGGRFSERPPRDKQSQKAQEEEHRRARSCHSFSQSPPNDDQYEERHNGKLSAFLSRKPGSDRGHDGKISVFSYSPHSLHESSEDGFARENCASRTSNCSVSDTVRTAQQSPNFLDNGCFNAPMQQDQSNVHTPCGFANSQMITVSSGSVDSISTEVRKSSLSDLIFDVDSVHGTQKSTTSTSPRFVAFSDALNAANGDISKPTATQQHPGNSFDESVDLFANIKPVTSSADKILSAAPAMDNTRCGWATFDTPIQEKEPSLTQFSGVAGMGKDKQAISGDLFSFGSNDQPTWFQISKNDTAVTNQSNDASLGSSSSQPWSVYNATSCRTQDTFLGDVSLMTSESQKPKGPIDRSSPLLWHSFDDIKGVVSYGSHREQPQSVEGRSVVNISPLASNPFTCSLASKDSHDDDFNKIFMDVCTQNTPLAFSESSLGGASVKQVTFNPFDVPSHAESGTPDLFMDLNSLQEALPNPDLPAFLGVLPEAWFSNSPCGYVPSLAHGGPPCLVEQTPNSPLQ